LWASNKSASGRSLRKLPIKRNLFKIEFSGK
jgi:hypothetical protein